MKGQGEIVAIILVLMIVVSLVALAYIWFTGVFGILTRTAGTGIEQTAGVMTTSFLIEIATYKNDIVEIYIKNVGKENINLAALSLYFDKLSGVYRPNIGTCTPTDCTDNILTTGNKVYLTYDLGTEGKTLDCSEKNVLRITTAKGLIQAKTIKCV